MWISAIVLALLFFWGIGAYNRIVRLRAAVMRAFAAFDAQLLRALALVSQQAADQAEAAAPASMNQQAALEAAGDQLAASLAVARQRPLDADAAAALTAGEQTLGAAWQALVHAAALASEGVAPPALAALLQQREQIDTQSSLARQEFNTAVERYNTAVAQFPASVLAWLFGLRRAQAL